MTEAEFRAELDRIRPTLMRFAVLQLRDEQSAEDAVQDTLLAALEGRERVSGRSQLKTWVVAILRNKIVDLIRIRARTTNVSAMSEDEQQLDEAFEALFKANAHWRPESRPYGWGDPEESLREQRFWDVFEICLNHLPENTSRVFMMREFLEFETTEVCRELSLTTSNCNVILHRARNGLRKCLQGSWFAAGEQPC